MPPEQLTDEALMTAYQQGDVRGFETLLERHRGPLYRFLLRQVSQTAVAEDLFQDLFIRILQNARSYRQESKFTTWAYTIARNLCIDYRRRNKYRQAASLDAPVRESESGRPQMREVADERASTDRGAIATELRARIQRAVGGLTEEQREVFLLREDANLAFKEIAQIVDAPENTVKSRMRYALEKLRQELSDCQDIATGAARVAGGGSER